MSFPTNRVLVWSLAGMLVLVTAGLVVSLVQPRPAEADSDLVISHDNFNGGWSEGAFTDVVSVSGKTKSLYISGIGSEDPDGTDIATEKILGGDDMREQTRIAYEKLGDILEANDATFANVVKITTYVTDITDYIYNAGDVMGESFATDNADLPSHTLVEVGALSFPQMKVEIDATVVVPDPGSVE